MVRGKTLHAANYDLFWVLRMRHDWTHTIYRSHESYVVAVFPHHCLAILDQSWLSVLAVAEKYQLEPHVDFRYQAWPWLCLALREYNGRSLKGFISGLPYYGE